MQNPFHSLPLKGLGCVLTGASQGVGRGIMRVLASRGMRLFLGGRRPEVLAEAASEALALGASSCQFSHLNLSSTPSIKQFVQEAQQGLSTVEVLIHCAGAYTHRDMETATLEAYHHLWKTNVVGPYSLTQALLGQLKAQQGQIIFVNSSQGLSAKGKVGQYASTQHALKAIADSLRQEVNQDGVRVLNLFLGRTASPRMEQLFHQEQTPYRPELLMQPEDVGLAIAAALSLPYTAELTQIHLRPMKKSY